MSSVLHLSPLSYLQEQSHYQEKEVYRQFLLNLFSTKNKSLQQCLQRWYPQLILPSSSSSIDLVWIILLYNWIEEESLSSLIKWILCFIFIYSYEFIICLLLRNNPKWLIIWQMQSSHYLPFYEQHIRTSYQHFVPLSFLLQLNDIQHQSQDHLSIHQSYSIYHTNCSSVNNSNPGCSCNWFLCHSDNSSTSVIVYKIPPGRK